MATFADDLPSAEGGVSAWLTTTIMRLRPYWILLLALAFVAGVLLYYRLPFEPSLSLLGIGVLLQISGLVLGVRRGNLLLAACIWLSLFTSLGLLRATVASALHSAPVVNEQQRLQNQPILVEQLKPNGTGRWRVLVRLVGAAATIERSGSEGQYLNSADGGQTSADNLAGTEFSGLSEVQPLRAWVSVSERQLERWGVMQLVPGQFYRSNLVIYPLYQPAYAGAWDSGRDYWLAGLGAQGYLTHVSALDAPQSLSATGVGWQLRTQAQLYQWRAAIAARINEILPQRSAQVATAITVGIRDIKPLQYETWRRAGMTHLLAISGLHMGMLTIFFLMLARYLGLLIPRIRHSEINKFIACGIAIVAAFVYLLLSGGSISAQRAFIMAGFAITAVMLLRNVSPIRIYAIALLLTASLQPAAVLTAGFQLSFTAVLALILFFQARMPANALNLAIIPEFPLNRLVNFFVIILLSSTIASLVTAPLTIYHFGSASFNGVFTNVLAIPITSLLLLPTLALAVLLQGTGVDHVLLITAGWWLALLDNIAQYGAQLPFRTASIAKPQLLVLLVLFLGLGLLLQQRRNCVVAGTAMVLAALGIHQLTPLPIAIISGNYPVVMLRDAAGVSSNSLRLAGFEQSLWRDLLGETLNRQKLWRDFIADSDTEVAARISLRCHNETCWYNYQKHQIKFSFATVPGQDATVNPEPAELAVYFNLAASQITNCIRKVRCIDKADLRRNGTVMVYANRDQLILEFSNTRRHRRPWHIEPVKL